MASPTPLTIKVSLPQLAKLIDHALLQPTLTDAEILTGLQTAKQHNVATACIKPYSIPAAVTALAGSPVLICSVIGFPHGNSTTEVKVFEARSAVDAGAHEIDMVVNGGKVLGGDWRYVEEEIQAINDAVVGKGAVLKVIFENDYLRDEHIVKLCEICTRVGVAFVKTSSRYGFVKKANGDYNYKGATVRHVELMRRCCGEGVRIKAAGGVRTVDEFLWMMHLGVARVGTSGTVGILEEARRRGIGDEEVEVQLVPPGEVSSSSGGY